MHLGVRPLAAWVLDKRVSEERDMVKPSDVQCCAVCSSACCWGPTHILVQLYELVG
jgi:hypothetical protein